LTKNVFLKAFLSDFQTCLRHFSERCPPQIFGAAHVWYIDVAIFHSDWVVPEKNFKFFLNTMFFV